MASSSSSSPLEDLETQLEMFVENVRQIRIIVADFQPQGQTVLNQKIQNAVTGLQEINKLKSNVQDIHVPLEVFEYIDRGRNPQLYTKDCIEKALHKNEQVKGKIDALKKFKANVLTDLGQTFPNELNKYRALRSNCYGGPNSQQQQQSLLGGSSLSIQQQQQQLNNASSIVSSASSCLTNSQQQSNSPNITSLLGCDGISTVSVGSNSNNIGGPPGT
ncbi:mediator of RNA polymerase II transcription subunit 10 isoform X2 [Acyrthosiphon pisum]|uniref:Mediator of RNA polymerase II transcription subunit 10 n=1 Tax=Acyrthosiphon pisum TaxID=7029 RepID=A0A8R2B503_ACYPI|nr:mediator of RNA polymerase II transcription subunit 10 isoform X2 [Acyrthosiphon pisum]XP_060856561.1 mediator of RNA polymerase II transcription subunit 10 isoform X2 [Metopolophium dirhodum]|eukprot:XP_008182011.1 PREDICTED: mediator of RNA polymerase II transcription subunit 10 isoform X2 [Acyrthosiphon pisum]